MTGSSQNGGAAGCFAGNKARGHQRLPVERQGLHHSCHWIQTW